LDSLDSDWGGFVNAFFQLTSDQRRNYLSGQGYPTFSSLVAHISAWWERAIVLINNYRNDTLFNAPPVDVDVFNQRAIMASKDQNETTALIAFEHQIMQMRDLVEGLSDDDLADSRITHQLEIELIGHFNEHRIEKPAVN
jgi:hypothetical protein